MIDVNFFSRASLLGMVDSNVCSWCVILKGMPRSRPRKPQLDEVNLKVYKMLLERFGEPIHDQPATVGARDEGPDGKALWNDEPKHDRNWSDPNVVREGDDEVCDQCGMMHGMDEETSCGMDEQGYDDDMDEVAPPGWEGTVKAMKKHSDKIDNPWALSWYMKDKGAKSHYTKGGKKKSEAVTPPPASGVATHMNEDDLDEKTPPGGERVVKALKKNKNVKNPWAVAWSMKNKGAKFKRK
jgi:hypothetical protein